MQVESVLPLVIGISLLSLAVALFLARQVLAADTGKPEMREISDAIREGAEAFLSRQYRTIAGLSLVAAAAIFGFYYVNREVKNIAEMGAGTFWRLPKRALEPASVPVRATPSHPRRVPKRG